jgi:hypothetical protein
VVVPYSIPEKVAGQKALVLVRKRNRKRFRFSVPVKNHRGILTVMSHEEIRNKLSELMRGAFDRRLAQLQELKKPLAGFVPDAESFYEEEWISEIDIDEMKRYFEGSNPDERDQAIELAMDQSKLFRQNMVDIGYLLLDEMANMKLKF